MKLEWDARKRRSNLHKHGLDFVDAADVLESRYRLDLLRAQEGEMRLQSFSYVMNELAVLTAVHTERGDTVRIISFRFASNRETERYYDWLGKEDR